MSEPSIQKRLLERVERAPERPALLFYRRSGEHSWISYGEFFREAASMATALDAQGLKRGDSCLVVLPSGRLAALATLAIWLRGALPLLVSPPLVAGSMLDLPRILTETARRSQARLVLCSQKLQEMSASLETGAPESRFIFDVESLAGSGERPLTPEFPAADAVGGLQLTSGTTGFPRICVWRNQAMLAALDGMRQAMRITEDDVCVNWTPLYHDMGLVNNFLLCLTQGVPLVMISPEEFVRRPELWLQAIHSERATISWSPNFGFALATQRIRNEDLTGVRLDHVRGIWNAAERIHHQTLVAFEERFTSLGLRPEAIKTNFGCAENIGGATFSDVDVGYRTEWVDGDALLDEHVAHPVDDAESGRRKMAIVGVGRAHDGMKIDIVDESGDCLADGSVGRIALRTPSSMDGYLGDPEATAGALRHGRLETGDLGYMRGEELFWVGRDRERITLRGKKIDPSDFEPVLLDVDGLREGCFVAFGVDDAESGTQRVVLLAEVRNPENCDPDAIVDELRHQLFTRIGVHVSEIRLLPPRTLAKTSSGKRRHRHYREQYLAGTLDDLAPIG